MTVEYKLEYGATYATLTTVADNLQNVSLSYGRQAQLDQYNANTASVTLRYPNGYVSPNASWITGTWVRISVRLKTTSGWVQLWVGRIANVMVEYGIPYVSSVGNADYVTLVCEGNFAAFGRVQGNGYAMTAKSLSAQIGSCITETGLNLGSQSGFGGSQQFPATTISSTWGDWVNRTVLTMNGRLIDSGDSVGVYNAYYKTSAFFGNFSDTANDASNHCYEKIAFTSLADNYYTQVTVTPESYSAATVSSGSAPYRTYAVNTLNNSTSQATDYANYLLSNYKTPALRIASITCNLNAQITQIPAYGSDYVSTQVSVAFRGTTYQCVIEGATFSGTPAEASVTFYFSSADLNNYLLLDNAVYGKLDSNKLGY
jgi:hypothetical protein